MKNKQEMYKKRVEMSRNNDYTTGYLFFISEKHQKTILNFPLDLLNVAE